MNFKPVCGDAPALTWIKSSYSGADGPDCVEIATVHDTILIRDSKNPNGPRLAVTSATWATFLPYASAH